MAGLDFHYYCIDALAKQVGFTDKEAFTIAYASQYTDDCNDLELEMARAEYSKRLNPGFPTVRPITTQAMSLDALDYMTQRYVLVPFHFIPGDDVSNPFLCTANSNAAIGVINEAIENQSLYSLGIALHSYADSFFHQNFIGFDDPHNEIIDWKTLYRAIVPDIAHANVGNAPDEIHTVWYDLRMPKGMRMVDNRAIAMRALYCCYQALMGFKQRSYIGPNNNLKELWEEHWEEWNNFTAIEDFSDRVEYIKRNYDTKEYNRDDHNFHDKGFIKFQGAAKRQLALILSNCDI